MNLQELLLKTIEENRLVQKNFIQEIEEEVETSIEIPTDGEEFKRIVLDYMSSHGIELSQTNYDYVGELLRNNQDGELHEVLKKKKQINTLGEHSLDELKDILQVCILKQCEKLCELMEESKNAKYEYAIERVSDVRGSTDVRLMSSIINAYAEKGWRVKSVFTNELGHNVSSVGVGMVSSGINSTADEVVIVFERQK